MKLGETTLQVTAHAVFGADYDLRMCRTGFEYVLQVSLGSARSVTLKAFSEEGKRKAYRRHVEIGKKERGLFYQAEIDGEETEIYPSELRDLGIEPEANIEFWLEVWT